MTPSDVPTVTLNDSATMPVIGFGVYQIPPEDTERCVADALEVGYRHIDTAAAYRNEEAVGKAISASGVPRDEVFVTTKLWVQDPGEANTRAALERSLERLGMDRVDLYLMHQPFGDVYAQWRAMQQAQADGLARSIGVSNFHPDRLVDLITHHDVAPAVNQIETHPFYVREDDHTVMAEYGVVHESWGPFAEAKNGIFEHPVLTRIARGHQATVAQVVLRWLLQRDVVVIPKSVRRERMAENFDVFDLELTRSETDAIDALDEGVSQFLSHRDPEIAKDFGTHRVG